MNAEVLVPLMEELTRISINWSLEANPHTTNYESMEAYHAYTLGSYAAEADWCTTDFENAKNLYSLHCHPYLPTSSYALYGTDTQELFKVMVDLVKGDRIRAGEDPSKLADTATQRINDRLQS